MEWMDLIASASANKKPGHQGVDLSDREFRKAMDQDLNTPAALAEVFNAMNFFYKNPDAGEQSLTLYRAFIDMVRETFGCFEPESRRSLPSDVRELLDQRMAARSAKDFAASDRLREKIRAMGYEVRDEGGQTVRKL